MIERGTATLSGEPEVAADLGYDGGPLAIGIVTPATAVATAGGDSSASVSRIPRNTVVTLVALITFGATRVIYGSMISRTTDPETYGAVGLALGVSLLASFLLPAGVASAMARFIPYDRGRGDPGAARSRQSALTRLGFGSALVLGVLSGLAAQLLGFAAIDSVQWALLTIVYSMYVVDKAAFYALDRLERYLVLEVVAAGVTLTATVAVLVSGSNLLLAPLILGHAIFLLGSRHAVPQLVRGELPKLRAPIAAMLGYVALACVGTLANAGFLQATQLISSTSADPAQIGYVAAIVTLLAPTYFLPRALGLALFPAMSEAHGAGLPERVRSQADATTRGLIVALMPLFAAAILLSSEILVLFGGEAFEPATPAFQIFLAGGFFAAISVGSVNALSSKPGWDVRVPVLFATLGAVVGIAVGFALAPQYGAIGVAIAYMLGVIVNVSGPTTVVWRRYHMPWAGAVIRSTLALMGALVVGLALDGFAVAGLPSAVPHVAVAAVVLTVCVALIWPELRSVWRAVRPRGSIGYP